MIMVSPAARRAALRPPPPGLALDLQQEGALRKMPTQGAVREALDVRRRVAPRIRIHERHELVREAGHRAADADAADVRAAADPGHPAALGHVAVDDRAPAADLHQALGRVVVGGEVALLVVAGAVAALMDGLAEDPGGSEL